MNFLHIAGHLGADPEVRFTSSGQKVTVLRVAARLRKKADKDRTIWWRVTVWGELFDKMISFLKKGSPVVAFGEMEEPHIYNDREGNPQASMSMTASSLQFSPFGRSENRQQEQPQVKSEDSSLESSFDQANQSGFTKASGELNDAFPADEEIPF